MNRKILKLSLITFALLFFCTLTSCKKTEPIQSYSDMDRIVYQGILNEEGQYLVFIYGDNCLACEELESLLCNYATKAKNKKVICRCIL